MFSKSAEEYSLPMKKLDVCGEWRICKGRIVTITDQNWVIYIFGDAYFSAFLELLFNVQLLNKV